LHAYAQLDALLQQQDEHISGHLDCGSVKLLNARRVPVEGMPDSPPAAAAAATAWAQWKGLGGLHIGHDSWGQPVRRTFLAIYQSGHQVWVDEAVPEVRALLPVLAGS
jgi:hypothetical protein